MDTDPFRDYRPDVMPHPLRRIGRVLMGCVTMHQLSKISDHTFEHPLDTPVQPVVDWPGQEM